MDKTDMALDTLTSWRAATPKVRALFRREFDLTALSYNDTETRTAWLWFFTGITVASEASSS